MVLQTAKRRKARILGKIQTVDQFQVSKNSIFTRQGVGFCLVGVVTQNVFATAEIEFRFFRI